MKPVAITYRRERGLSVVELLVGVALSLMLLAGVMTLFANSRQTYESNERLARIQENGRFALNQITRDIRSAGYKGCARRLDESSPFHNRLFNDTTLLWNFALGVEGYEATSASAWTPTIDTLIDTALGGSDVLVARRPRPESDSLQLQSSMGDVSGDIVVADPGGAELERGDVVLVDNCRAASVIQVTSYSQSSGIGTIGHAQGSGASLSVPGNLDTSAGYVYGVGASVLPVESVVYFVKTNPTTNVPGLYRRVAGAAAEELVEGIEAMQILYGVDTNDDMWADQYQTAATIDTANHWDRVISVSVALLVRSLTSYGPDLDTGTYDLLGTELGPFNDRFQRMVFTTTATLRNQAK